MAFFFEKPLVFDQLMLSERYLILHPQNPGLINPSLFVSLGEGPMLA